MSNDDALKAAKRVHDLAVGYLTPLGPDATLNDLPPEQRAEVDAALAEALAIQERTGIDLGLRRGSDQ